MDQANLTKKRKHIRLVFDMKPEEYEKLKENYKTTSCRSMSDYIRNVLLKGPVTILFRNRSTDDLLEELIRLKNGLEEGVKKLSDSTEKLNARLSQEELITRIRLDESDRQSVFRKIEEIKSTMNKLYTHVCQYTPGPGN